MPSSTQRDHLGKAAGFITVFMKLSRYLTFSYRMVAWEIDLEDK